MPSLAEFLLAFKGCLRLLRFDERGLLFFDRSAQGARRSFGAALPIYFYFLLQIMAPGIVPESLDTPRYVAAMSLAYVYLWIAFPLVLLGLAELFDWRAKAPGAICVYNWLSLMTVMMHLPSLFLDFMGWFAQLSTILDYLALIYMLVLNGFAFRKTLGVGNGPAALLVLGDLALSQFLIIPAFAYLGQAH
jgi:hypothetical protein